MNTDEQTLETDDSSWWSAVIGIGCFLCAGLVVLGAIWYFNNVHNIRSEVKHFSTKIYELCVQHPRHNTWLLCTIDDKQYELNDSWITEYSESWSGSKNKLSFTYQEGQLLREIIRSRSIQPQVDAFFLELLAKT